MPSLDRHRGSVRSLIRSIPKIKSFESIVLLYLFTLHADQLSLPLGGLQIRLNNLIGILLLISLLLESRASIVQLPKSYFRGFMLLTLSVVLSLLLSPYKARCFFFLVFFLFTLLVYVCLPLMLIKKLGFDRFFLLLTLSFVLVGLYAFVQLVLGFCGIRDLFVSQEIHGNLYRPNAFAYEPSFYALYFTPFVIYLNYRWLTTTESPLTWTKILFVNFLYLVSTASSCIFGYMIFFGLTLFTKARRRLLKLTPPLIFMFGAFCALQPTFANKYFLKFFIGGIYHPSSLERLANLINAFKVFLSYPLFGVGLGGFPPFLYSAFLNYSQEYTFLYQGLLLPTQEQPLKLFEASSVSTELLASLGLFGLVGFGLLLVLFCKTAKQALQTASPERSSRITAFFIASLTMLILLQMNQGLLRSYVWVWLTVSGSFFLTSEMDEPAPKKGHSNKVLVAHFRKVES